MNAKPLTPLRAIVRTALTWAAAFVACVVWTAAELPL